MAVRKGVDISSTLSWRRVTSQVRHDLPTPPAITISLIGTFSFTNSGQAEDGSKHPVATQQVGTDVSFTTAVSVISRSPKCDDTFLCVRRLRQLDAGRQCHYRLRAGGTATAQRQRVCASLRAGANMAPQQAAPLLVLDGGIGHLLKAKGVEELVPGLPFDQLFLAGALANQLAPDVVAGVHSAYIAAGTSVVGHCGRGAGRESGVEGG